MDGRSKRAAWLCAGLFLFQAWVQGAQAAPLPAGEQERACWLKYTRLRSQPGLERTSVSFSNLADGYTVRTPFQVNFAVRGMGVAPAGRQLANTGHHHLLIDTPLPMSVTDKIPFSDSHKHFGGGQTGTIVKLPPGQHRLRLLFADHEHRPYFVYSKELKINVAGERSTQPLAIDPRRFDETCEAWYQDEVSRPRSPGDWLGVTNLRDGEPVVSPFSVHLGVEGFGISAEGHSGPKLGHFMVQVLAAKTVVQSQNLSNGATQATFTMPNGSYVMRVRLVESGTGRDMLPPSDHNLVVVGQERL